MAIYINDAIQNYSPKSLDNKYLKNGVTPYASTTEVNSFINVAYRSIGLTVLVGAQEYWYIGGTADFNLVVKNIPTSINWGDIQGNISNQIDLSNALSQREHTILPGTITQYWRGDKSWQTLTSDVVTEGSTNLYFTTARARQSISAGTGISYNSSTGVITCTIVPGTVSSVGLSITGAAITVSGSPVTTTGTLALTWAGTTSQYVTGAGSLVTFPTIPAQFNPIAGSGITISGTYPNITFNSVSGGSGTVTSVAVTMPAAFTVSGSPVTSAGTIAITGAGTTSQYIRGDGTLATFPGGTVTSVALTVPSGFTVTGSPITSTGTLAITTAMSGVVHASGGGFTAGSVNLATEVSGNLATSHLNSGTGATGSTFWRGDGTWAVPPTVGPAGTTGSVQFNSAGAFAADANLFWDNTNKRLGVGTNTPATDMQISGLAPIFNTTFTSTAQSASIALGSPDKGIASLTLFGSANATPNILTLLGSTGGDISIRTIATTTSAEVIRFTAANTVQVASLAGTGTRMVVTSPTGVLSAQSIPAGVTSVAVTVPAAFSVSGSPITSSGTIAITAAGTSSQYIRGDGTLATLPAGTGTVTSVGLTFTGSAVTVAGSPVTNSGTLALSWAGTTSQYVNGAGGLVTFPAIPAQFSPVAGTNMSITGTYPTLTFNAAGSVSSVALSMPSAFNVSGSPITSSGTFSVTGAGTTTQYIRGDGSLATFPSVGTLTSFSSGSTLLFSTTVTNPTTTPVLNFSLSTAPAHSFFGNNTGATSAPGYIQPGFVDLSGNIAVSQMNGGTGASSSTFWRGDGTWAATPASPTAVSYSKTATGIQNVTSFSGPVFGSYIQIGNWVRGTFQVTLTSSSGGTIGNGTFTQFSIAIPVGTASSSSIGTFVVQELGGTAYLPGFLQISSTTITFTYLTVHAGTTNLYGSFDYTV